MTGRRPVSTTLRIRAQTRRLHAAKRAEDQALAGRILGLIARGRVIHRVRTLAPLVSAFVVAGWAVFWLLLAALLWHVAL